MEYVPSDEQVRDNYVEGMSALYGEPGAEDYARAFDRWIVKVTAESFSEGVNFIDSDPSPSWGGSMVAGRQEAARRRGEATRPALSEEAL